MKKDIEFNGFGGTLKKELKYWELQSNASAKLFIVETKGSGDSATMRIMIGCAGKIEDEMTVTGDWERNEFLGLMKEIVADLEEKNEKIFAVKETRNYLLMLLRQTKSAEAERIIKDLIDYLEEKHLTEIK